MDQITTTGYNLSPAHLVAEHKGFFAEEGLAVSFHKTVLAPDHNKGMAEGRWNLTLSSADTMIARTTTDGVDFLLFMQAEEGLDASLIGRPGVSSIEQLRGQLLAGDPGDSNLDLIRRKIMRMHDIGEDQYDVAIIGSSPVRLKAFLEDRVKAAMLTPPSSEDALAAGGVLLARAQDYVPGWPRNCGWTLRKWLEGNRDLVVRFIRAWIAATDWLLEDDHREETLELLMKFEGLTRARAENAYRRVVPKARINPEAIRRVLDLRIELGVYPPPHSPPERFYDESYWRAAGIVAGD